MFMKIVYKIFGLIALSLVLQSRSGGPANILGAGVTGAPGSIGSAGTCGNAGCHVMGSFSPELSIQLFPSGETTPVEEYIPGETYTMQVSIMATSGTPAGYGFQAVALDASDANTGSWTNIPSGVQSVTAGGRDYVEHNASSAESMFVVDWVAPEAGTGDVTFYSAGLAINGNGSTSGDGVASNSLSISEAPTSSTTQVNIGISSLMITPNPVLEQTQISVTVAKFGQYQLNIVNASGEQAYSRTIGLQTGSNTLNLNLGDLSNGMYVLQLENEDASITRQLIKL